MLRTIKSTKYQKEISYYTEDIEQYSGDPVCTGYADDGAGAYEITFEERGGHYYIKDINEIEG